MKLVNRVSSLQNSHDVRRLGEVLWMDDRSEWLRQQFLFGPTKLPRPCRVDREQIAIERRHGEEVATHLEQPYALPFGQLQFTAADGETRGGLDTDAEEPLNRRGFGITDRRVREVEKSVVDA